MPRLELLVFENELSGVSHRSIVAIVLISGRFSVTNMTSSSSSRTIGRTVAAEFESSINKMLSVMRTFAYQNNDQYFEYDNNENYHQ